MGNKLRGLDDIESGGREGCEALEPIFEKSDIYWNQNLYTVQINVSITVKISEIVSSEF